MASFATAPKERQGLVCRVKMDGQDPYQAIEGNPAEDITALRRVGFVRKGGKVFRNP